MKTTVTGGEICFEAAISALSSLLDICCHFLLYRSGPTSCPGRGSPNVKSKRLGAIGTRERKNILHLNMK